MPARVDAALFDLYDTLVQPDLAVLDNGRAALAARAGVPVEDLAEQWRLTRDGRTLGTLGDMEAQIDHMLRGCGRPASAELVHELAEMENACWRRAVRPYDDVLPTLNRLRQDGYRLSIVSNCSCQAGAIVDSTGLRSQVDDVVLSCDVGLMKPDSAILRLALERLDVAPERAALVDDLAENLDAARQIGMRTYLIARPGQQRAVANGHARIEDLSSLEASLAGPG